ncbi:MAG TPA: DUF4160 domain-containing protein [Myxococcota bacterium]|nr:DUF4160 domain-containing protein [Myxococcota bacterium]
MPTVERAGPYRFFFFENAGREPPHIHVERDACLAKFWLRPVALASSIHFSSREIGRILRLVSERRDRFEEAWHEFFRP